jgi:hypothetical protein
VVAGGESFALMASQALATTEQQLAVWFEPPATGEGGRLLSPVSTLMSVSGIPRRSEAIWATTVRTPTPISWAAMRTWALPLANSRTRAVEAPTWVG